MKATNRSIVVKTFLDADEFIEFERRCKDSDVSQSRAIRDLVKKWLHRSATRLREKSTRAGPSMAFPGRRGGAPVPLPLRL